MPKSAIRVMVTGVGGGGHGEQIIKALHRSERDYWILGTDLTPACSGFAIVDQAIVVPKANEPTYIETILELCQRFGIRAVFHGSEPEMYALAAARKQLQNQGIYLPINPDYVLSICRDKIVTAQTLRKHGFAVPYIREVCSLGDVDGYDRFPVVLKPSIGGGGSANVFIAQDKEELKWLAQHLLYSCPRFMLQEYVGTPDAEYTVGVLFGMDGGFINSIGVRRIMSTAMSIRLKVKNRTGRAELGDTLIISSGVSQGEIGKWKEVTSQCEAIAKALGPTAPINIQCRLVEGQVQVFEINPRFSGTTSVRAMVGYNEPDVLIRRDLLGEHISPGFGYRAATVMRGLIEYEIRDRTTKTSSN